MTIIEKYMAVAKEKSEKYAEGKNLSPHIIHIMASIMLTRDNELQGGSFVQAIVNNNLDEAINRADDECIKHLKMFSIAKRFFHVN
jgi:hypothetical protein